jgi:hypothetical protein
MDLLEKIWTAVGHIEGQLNQLRVEFKGQRKDLNYHIRKTNLLEEEAKSTKAHVDKMHAEIRIVTDQLQRDIWKFKVSVGIGITIASGVFALLAWIVQILLTNPKFFGV